MDFESLWTRAVQPIGPVNRRGDGTSWVGIGAAAAWRDLARHGRVYVKRQRAYFCRPPWNAFRRTPTLRREVRFIAAARALGVTVPNVLQYAEDSADRAVLVLEAIEDAADLADTLAAADAQQRSDVLRDTGATLARLHGARILHGAIYPKHVLIGCAAPHAVWLIDFEKARRVSSRMRAAELDLARLLRHAPFMTPTDLTTLLGGYDQRLFPGLHEAVEARLLSR